MIVHWLVHIGISILDCWCSCPHWRGSQQVAPCAGQCRLHTMNQQQVHGLCYDDIAVLQSRTARAWYYRRWCAPCTIRQRHNYVLDLFKLTYQHLVELQEPSVSFNLAILRLKMSLEHDKESIAQGRCRASGTNIGGFTERCQEGTKSFSHTLYQFDIDVNLRETWQHDKVLSSLISSFCILS